MDIASLLTRHAAFRGSHPALDVAGETLSFAELNGEVNRLANGLLAAGVAKGQKVATVLPNCRELMLMYLAAAKTGIVVVPLSTLLQKSGLRSLIHDADAVLLIAHADFAATLGEIRAELPKVREIFLVGTPTASGRPYAELIAGASTDEPPAAGLRGEDAYNIMYSSGTTGLPKGIVHSHRVRAHYGLLFAAGFRMTPESVVLHAGAIVFNGAMVDMMPWLLLGARYILHEAFDPARVIAEIARARVTHIVLVPSQIVAILNHPDFAPEKLESLEMITSVGAPLHRSHKQRLMAALPDRFNELYGLTEGFITILDKTDAAAKQGSVGCPTPFEEMCILDDDGRELPLGEVGEICGRGPLLMTEYYRRPEQTAEVTRGGWLHSGDLGYVDADGYLYLVDRKKDMIVSGGVNVYPRDIEEVLAGHDAVAEVAVFGVADAKWGEIPIAAVVPRPGHEIDPASLRAWTNDRVAAKFQRLHDVIVLTDFPRNVAGKTLKREIAAKYLARPDRAVTPAGRP